MMCISIIDPREGQVEKHFMGEELDRIHNRMRWEESKFWTKCPRVVEKLLFSQSDKTIGYDGPRNLYSDLRLN